MRTTYPADWETRDKEFQFTGNRNFLTKGRKSLSLVDVERMQKDQIINLLNQGYKLDRIENGTIYMMSSTGAVVAVVIIGAVLWWFIWTVIGYKVGKWGSRKLGLEK